MRMLPRLRASSSRRWSSSVAPFHLKHPGSGYINGRWVAPATPAPLLPVIDPGSGAEIGRICNMGAADATSAVAAARVALPSWSRSTASHRSDLLRALCDSMKRHSESLAVLLSMECGKPVEEAKGEVAYAASFIDYFAEAVKHSHGDVIPPPRSDRRMVAYRQPVGVAALLTPWNFSSAMVTRKLAPALAAGCTAILRPSAATPLSALAIVQLAEEVGFPPGVINLILGEDHDALAGTLCTSPGVNKVSFTGSTRVGRMIAAQCASTLKRVSLELGGNAPFIVFEDADLDAAVEGAVTSKFRNAGQTCVCANRIFVHESLYARFVEAMTDKASKLKVGHGLTPGVQVGPVISPAAVSKIEHMVTSAVASGARVTTGGRRMPELGGGNFYAPTVLVDVTDSMTCVSDEIFGPVAPIVSFKTEDEVVQRANAVDVGLAGYFYSRDISRAWRVADALEVGMVGVNTGIISTAAGPFGGVKQSGYGREGSRYGMDEYTNMKYVMMGV